MKQLLLALVILTIPSVATAQHEQIWLARYCINEAGWQISTPWESSTHKYDCPAMARSLMNNFRGHTLTTRMMRGYGDNVFNRHRTNRPYIPFLRTRIVRPRHWGSRASWARHLPRFVEVYELAGKILSGEVTSPPECRPHHWGAPSLHRRSLRRRWVQQDCGPSVNEFWNVPSRTVIHGRQ